MVRARNAAQDRYLAALRKYELVFAEGPAGTGKTWLAVGHAVSLLEQGLVERLILSRPAVEAGERLGFLPGDMKEKVDPYLRPIYDALYDFMDGRMVERGIQTGMIEIAPLAFMRGRTLSKAAVLLDEAQNATAMQMKMFLTRLGEGSRMMINGDPSSDRPRARAEVGAERGDPAAVVQSAHRPRPLRPRGRRAARSRSPDRRGLRARRTRGAARRGDMKLSVDISAPSPLWRKLPRARAIARETVAACVSRKRLLRGAQRAEVSVLLTGDAEVQRAERAMARPGQADQRALLPRGGRRAARDSATLGDIALAFETLAREAERRRRSARGPLPPSRAHGFLHLIGYDHETDEEAERMEALEKRVLARLGVADPYADGAVTE